MDFLCCQCSKWSKISISADNADKLKRLRGDAFQQILTLLCSQLFSCLWLDFKWKSESFQYQKPTAYRLCIGMNNRVKKSFLKTVNIRINTYFFLSDFIRLTFLWRNFSILFFQFINVCRHLFMQSSLKVSIKLSSRV